MATYFTDREHGPRPRTRETIDDTVWGALYGLIATRLADGSIGYRFPEQCLDGKGPCGGDQHLFELVAKAEVWELAWPLNPYTAPPTPTILDLLGLIASSIGEPIKRDHHPFYGHDHLAWDRTAGLERFVADVNRVFARAGIAFEMTNDGEVRRLLPEPLRNELAQTLFRTGDNETDRLLELARAQITRRISITERMRSRSSGTRSSGLKRWNRAPTNGPRRTRCSTGRPPPRAFERCSAKRPRRLRMPAIRSGSATLKPRKSF